MRLRTSCLILLILLLAGRAVNAATIICNYKDNKQAAFSMSFDDSIWTQANYVIPMFISKGLVGSILVVPGRNAYGAYIMEWESTCSRYGFELWNHTFTHPGPPVARTWAETEYLIGEAAKAIWALRPPGKSKLMLHTWPYGDTTDSILPSGWEALMVKYSSLDDRTGHIDSNFYSRGYKCVDRDGSRDTYAQLVTKVSSAITNGTWFGPHWHGVGPEAEYNYYNGGNGPLNKTYPDFEQLCDYVVSVSSILWIGTNIDVHMYNVEKESATISTIEDTASIVRLNLTSPGMDPVTLDPTLYDYPLTLITDVPAGWSYARISQAGKIITVKPVNAGRVMYDVVPNRGEISIVSSANDTTAPSAPVVRDGTGASDADSVTLTTEISANWDASVDAESGIAKYWYRIGTTAGGSELLDWIDNGTCTYVITSRTNIALSKGIKYYVSVKTVNGVGMESPVGTSNGQTVPVTAGYVKFSDDFETGGTSGWTSASSAGANTIEVVSEAKSQGNYGLKCHIADTNAAVLTKTDATNLAGNFVRFSFKLSPNFYMVTSSINPSLVSLMSLNDANGSMAARVYISKMPSGFGMFVYLNTEDGSTLPLPMWPAQYGIIVRANCIPISTGAWHTVDVHALAQGHYADSNKIIITGPRGGVELWLDGVKKMSFLSTATGGKNGRHLNIGADNISSGTSGDIYFDNIVLSDSLYAAPSSTETPPSQPPVNPPAQPGEPAQTIHAYPNPCRAPSAANPAKFRAGGGNISEVSIYTVSGRLIRTLPGPGAEIAWDGKNEAGEKAARGLYVYKITSNIGTVTGKLVLTK